MTNNVFVYVFGGPTNSKSGRDYNYAAHGNELSFIFDWEDDNYFSGIPWSQSLSNSMVSSWTNFGIYGHPNVTNQIDNIDIIWNEFGESDGSSYMMIWNDTGKNIETKTYQHGGCQFLNTNNGFSQVDIC
eukprot:294279_1